MEKLFKLKERGTTVSKELVGGLTTFLAMAYILAVNPDLLSTTITSPTGEVIKSVGLQWGPVFTATAISAAIGTLCMAFMANLPVALASGMGLNAFFAFTVCLGMGCSYQLALTAVLIEGILFIILSLCGIRQAIVKSIPESLKKAVAVGIGLFIALIGLSNAGIAIGSSQSPLIGFVNFDGEHKAALVAVLGLIITIVLYVLKVPGAILIGIILTTLVGIPFGVTSIPEGFKPVAVPDAPEMFAFDFKGIFTDSTGAFSWGVLGQFFVIFFTFLFTDMFDTIGTLLGVAEQANLKDENGDVKNAKGALLADAVGTVAGACLGTSTVTSFVESSSGVASGARTGLANVFTAIFFLLALFLGPLFGLIPSAATAPALIFVGFLMMKSVVDIDFKDLTEGIPAFITIMVMPFSYSISKGIMWGIIAYVIAKCAGKKAKEIPVVTWILAVIFIADIVFESLK